MIKHPLHRLIGDHIRALEFDNMKVLIDPACGGDQNIPLFIDEPKSNATEICNVDLLITKNNLIQVIIEIEETNTKPTQILGKLMTAVLAKYHIHKRTENNRIQMSDNVLFIQVLNTRGLKDNSSKINQWKNIESNIETILPRMDSKIKSYRLFYGSAMNINLNEISDLIMTKIKTDI